MKKRILYVEDNPKNMLLVKRILDALGHTLLAAEDGEEGWRMVVDHVPDLILMDLRLPGELNGFDLMRRIKEQEQLRHIPIVVLTGYGYEEVQEKAIVAGCDGFLSKPADIRQIRATINEFLKKPAAGEPDAPRSAPAKQPPPKKRHIFI